MVKKSKKNVKKVVNNAKPVVCKNKTAKHVIKLATTLKNLKLETETKIRFEPQIRRMAAQLNNIAQRIERVTTVDVVKTQRKVKHLEALRAKLAALEADLRKAGRVPYTNINLKK